PAHPPPPLPFRPAPAFPLSGALPAGEDEHRNRRLPSQPVRHGAVEPAEPATTRLGDRHQIGAEGFCFLRDLVGGRSETYHRLYRDALKLGFGASKVVEPAVGDALHLLALVRHDAAVVAALLLV